MPDIQETPPQPLSDAQALEVLGQIAATQNADLARIKNQAVQEEQQRKDASNVILQRYYRKERVNADGNFFMRHIPDKVIEGMGETGTKDSPVAAMERMTPERRQELRARLSAIPAADVVNSYFNLHSEQYLQEIDGLVNRINPEKRDLLTRAKMVVSISARNETDLQQVIQTLRNSYGNAFEEEVGVVVYHNFATTADEVPPDVMESAAAVGKLPNVAVISDQIEQGRRLPEVKKRASDCTLRLTQANPEQTLVFTDADLRMLSANGLQEAQIAVAESGLPFSVVSTPQRPSEEVKIRFPLFYEKKRMDEYVYQALVEGKQKAFTFLGSFGVMTKKSFAGAGGWMPEEIHEDMRFDNQIRLASISYGSSEQAVIPGAFTRGIVTEFNPDRDLLAIHDQVKTSRFAPELYYKTSGGRRIDWQNIPQSEDGTSLLSGKLTEEGMISIGQQALESLKGKDPRYIKTAQAAVCRYLLQSGLMNRLSCTGHDSAGKPASAEFDASTVREAADKDLIIESISLGGNAAAQSTG